MAGELIFQFVIFLLDFKQVVKPVATEQSLAKFCLENAIFHHENEMFVRPLVIGFDSRSVPFDNLIISLIYPSLTYLAVSGLMNVKLSFVIVTMCRWVKTRSYELFSTALLDCCRCASSLSLCSMAQTDHTISRGRRC